MKTVHAIIAFGALAHAITAQAVTPAYIKIEGVDGESAKAQAQQPAARGGVKVATGDINGDGTTALLVPAVQRAAPAAPKPAARSKKPAKVLPAGETISLNF